MQGHLVLLPLVRDITSIVTKSNSPHAVAVLAANGDTLYIQPSISFTQKDLFTPPFWCIQTCTDDNPANLKLSSVKLSSIDSVQGQHLVDSLMEGAP